VVAIDGPSASGKSSTAGAVARLLGARHLDSGALYRGLTAVAGDLPSRTPDAILAAAERRGLALHEVAGELVPFLDGTPAEAVIRTPEVTALVSEVSALPAVRDWVNHRLREAARLAGLVVLDGRDIGTAVFPDAAVKLYLIATPEARARRRLVQRGDSPSEEEVAREAAVLADRDRKDSTRAVAPLRQADDAILLDTTDMDFDQQVATIVGLARSRLKLIADS
jgi:cytidylate kinase